MFRSFLLWGALLASASCIRQNTNPEIAPIMQAMGDAYAAARDAPNLRALAPEVERLRATVDEARTQPFEGSERGAEIHEEGLQELDEAVVKLEDALREGDLESARDALDEVGRLRGRYHLRLWVR